MMNVSLFTFSELHKIYSLTILGNYAAQFVD